MKIGNRLQKNKLIRIFVAILLVCFACGGASLAWFTNTVERDANVTGSSIGRFFADGDGSANDPYIINNSTHLYYLSWLQNRGYFSEKTYFAIDNEIDEIDMAGCLTGFGNTQTGAIPPIGNIDNPFLGVFNGNGKVIKNLWVSTNPAHWMEKPDDVGNFGTLINETQGQTPGNYKYVGEYVGLFGAIGVADYDATTDTQGNNNGEVQNFVLENIEITSHIVNPKVGIIAGYLNGALMKVGVKNARISGASYDGTSSSFNAKSAYVLVGEIGSAVEKNNLPGGIQGSSLIIDPATEPTQISTTGNYHEIEEATERTAYYVGNITRTSPQKISGFQRITVTAPTTWADNSSEDVTEIKTSSSALPVGISQNDVSDNGAIDKIPKVLYDRFSNLNDKQSSIDISQVPVFNPLKTFTGLNYPMPDNCIWFKPQNTGICRIVLAVSNMSAGIKMSVYAYNRDAENKVINKKRLDLVVPSSNGGLQNKYLYVFSFPITNLNKEYAVGKTEETTGQSNPTTKFYYLILPGTGQSITETDFTNGAPKLLNVDYAKKDNDGKYDVLTADPATYQNKKVALSFNAELDSSYFGPLLVNTDNLGNVNYYSENIILQNNFGDGTVGISVENNETNFPLRVTKKSSSPPAT